MTSLTLPTFAPNDILTAAQMTQITTALGQVRDVADATALENPYAMVSGSGIGVGNAVADTAAWLAAVATGRSVRFPAGSYIITAGATITTNGQSIVGDFREKTRITLQGTFDFITYSAGVYSPTIRDIHFSGYTGSQVRTGGYLVAVTHAVRVVLRDVSASNLTGFLKVTKCFELLSDHVTYEFHRTAADAIYLYGADGDHRVDNVYFQNTIVGSDGTTRTATGLHINGFVNSVESNGLYLVGGFRKGQVIEDTFGWSGGGLTSTPAIMRFVRWGVEYPSEEACRITAGLDITFDQVYALGSGTTYGAGASGFFIGAAVGYYAVQIGDMGKIAGFSRYAVEAANNQRVGGLVLASNTLGSFSTAVSGEMLIRRLVFSDNAGGVSNFVANLDSSGNAILGFNASGYMAYVSSANNWSLNISGVAVLVATGTMLAAGAPLQLPSYTVAGLPSAASFPRCMVYVSNGTANKRMAISDGTAWRWPDGAVVT